MTTDCNSMRRDITSSLRACLAAESWKKLYPERIGPGRPKKGSGNSKEIGNYDEFAMKHFKVNSLYAQQAATIAVHSPELLEDAKAGPRLFDFRRKFVRLPAWNLQPEELTRGAAISKSIRPTKHTAFPHCLKPRLTHGTPTPERREPSDQSRDTGISSTKRRSVNHWRNYSPKLTSASANHLIAAGGKIRFTMAIHRCRSLRCCEAIHRAALADGSLTRTKSCDATGATTGHTGGQLADPPHVAGSQKLPWEGRKAPWGHSLQHRPKVSTSHHKSSCQLNRNLAENYPTEQSRNSPPRFNARSGTPVPSFPSAALLTPPRRSNGVKPSMSAAVMILPNYFAKRE